jgi:hypothetical protein
MEKRVIAVCILLILLWLRGCSRVPPLEYTFWRPTPPLLSTWDTDPDTRLVLATFCCDGPISEELVRPYIPEAQIWGDSRYIWTKQNDDGARQVMVKQLTTDEMTELMQEITDYGFFNMEEQYVGEPVVDSANQCLTVALAGQSKTVCTTHGGAPDTFNALFAWLSQGAGMSSALYWPERANLTGFQLAETVTPLSEPDLVWPESLANVPVAEAITGLWLDDGEALRHLWEATNRNPYHMPVVEDGDARFRIILQVPGVSWIEP